MGDDHSSTITALGNLGATQQDAGEVAEAEQSLRAAMADARRALGDEHLITILSFIRLGKLLALRGEYAEAVSLLSPIQNKARSIFPGSNAHRVVLLLEGLGNARIGLAKTSEDFEEAVADLLESHELYSKTRGQNHKSTKACAQSVADAYAAWDKVEPGRGFDAKCAQWQRRVQ